MRIQRTCLFCREPTPKSEEEHIKLRMKRIEANDPVALRQEGGLQHKKGDYQTAFDYYTKATALGDAQAHYLLSFLYHSGQGVDKNVRKGIHHMEKAAIGGHPEARFNLGVIECTNGNVKRAVKHWVIAATQGEDQSIKFLMELFRGGIFSKDVLAAALRAHHAAVDATKSPQRKEAEEMMSR